ncbi:type III PLP-dependent enzyme [Azospirillum rugosum]|uniref:ornithine decarboxylase n=1 Tax=Azospirillum rugosum TaxID=416170 RepID=A0ABS4SEG4_9PROT|nr:type III PLP-dependent enzyme [Azospirillum rugosum]MBP2290973.1 ornithine decarboxylase [Azospirillum rugosum]MDQ0524963.1 ornithine decarboxylase [Azospirillum rugosum]
MGFIRSRSAVAPLRRGVPVSFASSAASTAMAPRRTSVVQAVALNRPEDPMHCIRPGVLKDTAASFVAAFGQTVGGDVLYAVKCNPEPTVLRALWEGGVRHFDVASPGEIRLIRQMFPDAELHYMHPVKGREAIRTAYQQYGVRDFVLDSMEELQKILEETGDAQDLGLVVRLALPKGNAVYDLSGKFGAPAADAVELLRAVRMVANKIGVSFHVGSQMLDPAAYERALELAGRIIADSGVVIDVLDVGGGFPVSYPGVTPPPLGDFMEAIARGVTKLNLPAHCRVWCEPGRALVAPGVSLVVQVIKRRGNELFINDGVYGALSDAGVPGFRFPARMIRPFATMTDAPLEAFSFYGPTCDSADKMNGPFHLPADIQAGDWIELGQLGAYGSCLRTAFNGFDQARVVEVSDLPLLATPGYDLKSCVA